MHVFLVDEDLKVAPALERELDRPWRPLRVQTATNSTDAEAALDRMIEPPDVVVAALASTRVTLELTELAKRVHPTAMRIVVLGRADERDHLQASEHAHQVLVRPTPPGVIAHAIETMQTMAGLVADPGLRAVLAALGRLPSAPSAWVQLCRILDDEGTTMRDVVGVVTRDTALATAVLKVVNSTFYSRGRTITDLEQAVGWIGFNHLRHLALQVSAFEQFKLGASRDARIVDEIQQGSVRCAEIARVVVDDMVARGAAYAAGLLADIGQVALLASALGDRVRALRDKAKASGLPLHLVERQELGTTHAEVGGYLLGLWGLPNDVVDAVSTHHKVALDRPSEAAKAVFAAAQLLDGRPLDDVAKTVPSLAGKRAKVEELLVAA